MAEAGSAGGLIGTLWIKLTAQNDELNKKMDDSEKKVVSASEKMSHAVEGLTHVLEALGVAFVVEKMVEFVHETIESIDELKKFSQEIGITIDKLAGLKFAADKANIGDQFQIGMRKFSQSLREAQVQGSDMQALFRDVLKVDPTAGVDEAFTKVVDQFSRWENGVNKMGMAQELFGTRNARFINLLNQGNEGIKRDIEELAKVTGVSYEEAARKAEEYNEAVVTLKASFRGLAITFIDQFLPHITHWITLLAEHMPQIREYVEIIGVKLNSAFTTLSEKGIPASINALRRVKEAFQDVIALGKIWYADWKDHLDKSLGVFDAPKGLANMSPSRGQMFGKAPLNLTGITEATPITADEWEQIEKDVKETAKGAEAVQAAMEAAAKAAKKMNDNVTNVDEFKDHQRRLRKFMDDQNPEVFGNRLGGLKSDVASTSGIQGFSDAIGISNQTREADVQIQELKKLQEERLKILEKAGEAEFAQADQQMLRLHALEELYAEKKKQLAFKSASLQLQTAGSMFGDLATITKAWAGQQSGIYKAMFAVSKAFAIADATVKIAQGIAAAAANPWPLNLFAMASVVAATASIVSSIQAVQLEFGGARAMGGPVSPNQAFLVGERGPEMFVPAGQGTIVPNDRLSGGGKTTVVIENHTDSKPEVREEDDNGEKVIRVIIRRTKDELASEARDGTGGLTRALQSTFGLRRSGQ